MLRPVSTTQEDGVASEDPARPGAPRRNTNRSYAMKTDSGNKPRPSASNSSLHPPDEMFLRRRSEGVHSRRTCGCPCRCLFFTHPCYPVLRPCPDHPSSSQSSTDGATAPSLTATLSPSPANPPTTPSSPSTPTPSSAPASTSSVSPTARWATPRSVTSTSAPDASSAWT